MNICDYGCGKEGKYQFKNKKYCCNKKWQQCPGINNNIATETENPENILCDYGCGLKGKYKFKNKKWCCSDNVSSCNNIKNQISKNIKKYNDGTVKIENPENKLCDYGCGLRAEYKFSNEKLCCSETPSSCLTVRNNMSIAGTGKSHTYKSKKIENSENKLCDYGCGLRAEYESKYKKLCCCDHFSRCPEIRRINSESKTGIIQTKSIKIENLENILCNNGCGLRAEYKFSNGNLYCSESINTCIITRQNISDKLKGKPCIRKNKPKKIENLENKLCDYGCGLRAEYELVNNMLCCNEHFQACPVIKKRSGDGQLGKIQTKSKKIENLKNKLCDYGCENKAEYELSNGLLCCNESVNSCLNMKKKNSDGNKGKIQIYTKPIKIENPENLLCDYGCGLRAEYGFSNGNIYCNEHWILCPAKKHLVTYSIEQWYEKYPTFAREEELRYNPDKPKEKEIQGHCKNSNCINSKEQNGWFTLSKYQFGYRVFSLEHSKGNDGGYFYCCEECKQQCPLYNLHGDPLAIPANSLYTQAEYETFKQEVLKKDNYICHFCGEEKATIVHHTRTQKLEPFFALDPDYGISVCEDCHHFIHRSKEKGGECSTGHLASIICTPNIQGIQP